MERLFRALESHFAGSALSLKELGKHVKTLSDLYRDFSPEHHKEYMKRRELRLAYLYYFYPLNVFKYHVLLNFYREYFTNKASFFDYGCGPLSFFSAILLSGIRPAALYCHDTDPHIISLGREILEIIAPGYAGAIRSGFPPKPVNALIFGNVLAELSGAQKERLLEESLRTFCDKTSNCILVVEPGTRVAFKQLSTIKDLLSRRDFRPLMPCPSNLCPMAADDWCHENLVMPRSPFLSAIEKITGLDNRFVNFSYLLMSTTDENIFRFDASTFRVVSNLMEHKGDYAAYLCGPAGIEQFSLLKRDLTDDNKVFADIRRGDIIAIAGTEKKAQLQRLKKTSTVTIKKNFRIA